MASSRAPMARSYLTPGTPLHQQRFEPRRRSVRDGSSSGGDLGDNATSKHREKKSRKQNTLTQMDFVRLGLLHAMESDGLELEYEDEDVDDDKQGPKMEVEGERPIKAEPREQEPLERLNARRAMKGPEIRMAMSSEKKDKGHGIGKRQRVKKEQGTRSGDEDGGTEDGDAEEDIAASSHLPQRKRKRLTKDLRKDSKQSLNLTTKSAETMRSPTLPANPVSGTRATTSKSPTKATPKRNARTPLQPKSVNLQTPTYSEQKIRHSKRPTCPMPRTPVLPNFPQIPSLKDVHLEVSFNAHTAGETSTIEKPTSPAIRAPSAALHVSEGKDHFPRYSDPELTIPDSEDEGETQDAVYKPAATPEKKPAHTNRLACEKSFSQATTVDASQPSPRRAPSQDISSPANKGEHPLPDSISTPRFLRRRTLLPASSSSLGSDHSHHGGDDAYPTTESQLLPNSLLNFELPPLPGWSQNSDEEEE